jgi:hypothetical protein
LVVILISDERHTHKVACSYLLFETRGGQWRHETKDQYRRGKTKRTRECGEEEQEEQEQEKQEEEEEEEEVVGA